MCYKKKIAWLVAGLMLAVCAMPDNATAAYTALFGSSERKSTRLKSFPKWTGVLDRHFDGSNTLQLECSGLGKGQCNMARWNRFISELSSYDRLTQLEVVNDRMNKLRYIIDPINWGVPDYWATPYQFFIKNGDCEDYAISKYMTLRSLGFPREHMRIVVLKDENLDIMHAVLAVYMDNKVYILDNQISKVVEHRSIYHYKPIFSINEIAWWRHR